MNPIKYSTTVEHSDTWGLVVRQQCDTGSNGTTYTEVHCRRVVNDRHGDHVQLSVECARTKRGSNRTMRQSSELILSPIQIDALVKALIEFQPERLTNIIRQCADAGANADPKHPLRAAWAKACVQAGLQPATAI